MPNLLIADDHPLFRAALRGAAADAVAQLTVREAESLDGVIATLEAHDDIDLVLLDLHMPGNHGLAGLAAIRAQFPAVAVVVVSANDDPRVVRRALDHGAAGYLPKSSGLDELAGITAFLTSPAARNITGQTIVVDGGWTVQ